MFFFFLANVAHRSRSSPPPTAWRLHSPALNAIFTPPTPPAPAPLHSHLHLHPPLQSRIKGHQLWLQWLTLGPARWQWQMNYPTGRGGWLSVEKSSGRRNPPISTPRSPSCPLRPPVSPRQEGDALANMSPWQVISTITITAITGVINKWAEPPTTGFII